MAMNTRAALEILAQIEALIDSEESSAKASGKGKYWDRDKNAISAIRGSLVSSDPERVRWAFDQMRNFSQGFGSYSRSLEQLDSVVDKLHNELAQLLSTR